MLGWFVFVNDSRLVICAFILFQEVAADPAAPVDDGTESLGDAPSLSEELAGYKIFISITVV